jgi:hypothetical protein
MDTRALFEFSGRQGDPAKGDLTRIPGIGWSGKTDPAFSLNKRLPVGR